MERKHRGKLNEQEIAALMLSVFVLMMILGGAALFRKRIFIQEEKIQDERTYCTINKELGMVNGVDVIHSYIPYDSPRRPGEVRAIKYVTIHETDNRTRSSNAYAHNVFLTTDMSDVTSWHYTVDADAIYHHIPDNEISWNAGDNRMADGGNMNGIAVEICVNVDGDYEAALRNAACLAAALLDNYDLTPEDLRFHQDFMHKVCPHRLITEGRLDEFTGMVEKEYEHLQKTKEVSEDEK